MMAGSAPIPKVSECPLDPEKFISKYLTEDLPSDEATYLEQHLKNCISCSELRRQLRIQQSLNEIENDLARPASHAESAKVDREPQEEIEENLPETKTLRAKPQSLKYTVGGRPAQIITDPPVAVIGPAWRRSLKRLLQKVGLKKGGGSGKGMNKYLKWSIAFLFSVIPIFAFHYWPSAKVDSPPAVRPVGKTQSYFESQLSGEFRRNSSFSTIRPMLNERTSPIVQFSWKDKRPRTDRKPLRFRLYANGEVQVFDQKDVKSPIAYDQVLSPGTYYWTLEDDSRLRLVSKFEVR